MWIHGAHVSRARAVPGAQLARSRREQAYRSPGELQLFGEAGVVPVAPIAGAELG